MTRPPNWNDLERGQRATAQVAEEQRRFEELCASVFSTPGGKALLIEMHRREIDNRSPQRSTEAQLREDEARRRFVAELEIAVARGLDSMANAKAKPA